MKALFILITVGGFLLAVIGLFRLSLAAMLLGSALFVLGGTLWERFTGRFAAP